MKTLGVDISHWEGNIDWETAGRWIPFVYYKCTDGTRYVDPSFVANQQGCEIMGIPHAPYHYYQPALDALAQAAHFVSTAGEGYHRLIVDVEEENINSEHLHSCLVKIEQLAGIRPAIYTSADKWNNQVKPFPAWSKDYELIVAHYTMEHQPVLPMGWTNWRMWQFTDHWYFPGCYAAADGDWFNGSLEDCREWFGNYRPVEPPKYAHVRMRSLCDGLHVRQVPRVTGKELGHLAKGEIVELEDLGGPDVWVKHSRGWSCVEHNNYRYMEVVR